MNVFGELRGDDVSLGVPTGTDVVQDVVTDPPRNDLRPTSASLLHGRPELVIDAKTSGIGGAPQAVGPDANGTWLSWSNFLGGAKGGSGCVGLQVDGDNFREIFVVQL